MCEARISAELRTEAEYIVRALDMTQDDNFKGRTNVRQATAVACNPRAKLSTVLALGWADTEKCLKAPETLSFRGFCVCIDSVCDRICQYGELVCRG